MTAFDAGSSGAVTEGAQPAAESAAVDTTGGFFPAGSIVECRTALSTRITGQVQCFDDATRLLVVKDTSSGAKPMLRFLNLSLVEQVSCELDGNNEPTAYTGCMANPQQVQERLRKAEARRRAALLEADVPIDGQRAFIHLRKTLDDVKWRGECISVLGRVLVRPPYTADSIDADGDPSNVAVAHAKEHVRKILSKHHSSSHQNRGSSDDAPADPTPSSR